MGQFDHVCFSFLQEIEEKAERFEKYKRKAKEYYQIAKGERREERANMDAKQKLDKAAHIQGGDLDMMDETLKDLGLATKVSTIFTAYSISKQKKPLKNYIVKGKPFNKLIGNLKILMMD